MINIFWKVAAAAIMASVLAAVLRRANAATALVFILAAGTVLATAGAALFRDARDGLRSLSEASGLGQAAISSLLKVCAIGLVTQFCEAFCRDAGSHALGRITEFCGNMAALYAAMPLLDSVLSAVREMLGG